MLQPLPAGLKLGKLLLADAKLGLGVFQRQNPAIAPDRIGAEIGDHRHGDGRNDQNGEKSGDRALDSHRSTESQSDSRRQGRFSKGFEELSRALVNVWPGGWPRG